MVETNMQIISDFSAFSNSHMAAIGLTFLLPVILSLIVRRSKSAQLTTMVCYAYALVLLGQEFAMFGWRLISFGWMDEDGLLSHLPFHICGVLVFLISVMLIRREQKLYEVSYFCGLVGTFGALVLPNLAAGEGFPSFRFIQYFMAHGGIIGGVLFATWGLRMRPTTKGLFQSFLAINGYMVIAALLNLLIRQWVPETNYMFLCEPPEIPLREVIFFLPHPWYILFLDLLTLILFIFVYLPFLIIDLIQKNKISGRQN